MNDDNCARCAHPRTEHHVEDGRCTRVGTTGSGRPWKCDCPAPVHPRDVYTVEVDS